jgi:predicted RecB family nuclease
VRITEGRLRLSASDVADFLAYQQLTRLELLRARGELRPPREVDLGFQELVRRGEEHERDVLERFHADGLDVTEISQTSDAAAAAATLEAIRGGADLIYQGTLTVAGAGGGPALFGRPDFLVRADLLAAPDGDARPGGTHYEVVDAKLARTAKARAVLQTSFYSRLLASESDGVIRYEILDPERDADGGLVANRGLLALPEPADGDLFFDIEGARYYSEDGREFGLQYLFGVVDTAEVDGAGQPRYTQMWAFDRAGEERAFEELIDFITERRARHSGLHVYHYNHYEPTSVDHLTELHGTRQEAVGALMGRFATREDEVDDLFRLGVFVDLYRVVRQGVRAGVESYSIKRLEPLCGYARQVDLGEATVSLIALEAALEDGTAAGDGERQRVVAGYHEDDCRATLALRDWLDGQRVELTERLGQELSRPVFAEKPGAAEDPETARIRSALLAGVSAETPGAIA